MRPRGKSNDRPGMKFAENVRLRKHIAEIIKKSMHPDYFCRRKKTFGTRVSADLKNFVVEYADMVFEAEEAMLTEMGYHKKSKFTVIKKAYPISVGKL